MKMKSLICLLVAGLCSVTAFASGLQTGSAYLGTNATSVAAATTNTTTGASFAAVDYKEVGIAVTFKETTATAGTCYLFLDASVDNTTWTPNYWTIPFVANGTTTVNGLTNLTVNGIPFFRLGKIGNTSSDGVLTNFNMTVFVKKPASAF